MIWEGKSCYSRECISDLVECDSRTMITECLPLQNRMSLPDMFSLNEEEWETPAMLECFVLVPGVVPSSQRSPIKLNIGVQLTQLN